ncbi:hypothetical protein LWI28_009287 [Acer negundo]|uniref:Uncharacterized protein n=1 Tax=Acer negundo TaxID=4023 RepID=A0AAD5I602_ACENE|nr:hypothetical protein LWI28_009287 [Acer negundo]
MDECVEECEDRDMSVDVNKKLCVWLRASSPQKWNLKNASRLDKRNWGRIRSSRVFTSFDNTEQRAFGNWRGKKMDKVWLVSNNDNRGIGFGMTGKLEEMRSLVIRTDKMDSKIDTINDGELNMRKGDSLTTSKGKQLKEEDQSLGAAVSKGNTVFSGISDLSVSTSEGKRSVLNSEVPSDENCKEVVGNDGQIDGGSSIKDIVTLLRTWNIRKRNELRANIQSKRVALKNATDTDSHVHWKEVNKMECELNEALDMEERYWSQRAKVKWLQKGDLNTRFIHSKASARKARNRINRITDTDGRRKVASDEVERIICHNFGTLFTTSNPAEGDLARDRDGELSSRMLVVDFTMEEFQWWCGVLVWVLWCSSTGFRSGFGGEDGDLIQGLGVVVVVDSRCGWV